MKKAPVLLGILLVYAQASAQTSYNRFMKAAATVNHFNGNVLVAKAGHIVYQHAFGYSNYTTRHLLDNESIFELQSITKQFTAMGIFMLIEKHLLGLQDTLLQFFPELPYPDITIEHLLTHKSGLPDDLDIIIPHWDHQRMAGNKDLIHILATVNMPAHFPAGQQFEYCNTDFELLAAIIEKVSHSSYADFMQQHIFSPLHMRHSYATTNAIRAKSTIPKFAYGFVWSDSLRQFVLPASIPALDFVFYDDGMYGAGNICTSIGDLFLFDRAVKNATLLPAATMKQLYKPLFWDSIQSISWNYASVKMGNNEFGDYIHAGVGGWPGYSTDMIRYLKNDMVVITLSNNESPAGDISGALSYIANGMPVVAPYQHHAITIDQAAIKNYEGSYTIPFVPRPASLDIREQQGKLFCYFNKSAEGIELVPESPVKFFCSGGRDLQIAFVPGKNRKPMQAFYIAHGMKKKMLKMEGH